MEQKCTARLVNRAANASEQGCFVHFEWFYTVKHAKHTKDPCNTKNRDYMLSRTSTARGKKSTRAPGYCRLATCRRRDTTSPSESAPAPLIKLFTNGACLNPSGSGLRGGAATESKSTVLTLLMAGL
jgi:hypothetical protein